MKIKFETFNRMQEDTYSRKQLRKEIQELRKENNSLKNKVNEILEELKLQKKLKRIFSYKLILGGINE